MVAPTLDRAPHLFLERAGLRGRPPPLVKQAGESSGGLWRGREEFGHFRTVDTQICEAVVAQAAGEPVDTAD